MNQKIDLPQKMTAQLYLKRTWVRGSTDQKVGPRWPAEFLRTRAGRIKDQIKIENAERGGPQTSELKNRGPRWPWLGPWIVPKKSLKMTSHFPDLPFQVTWQVPTAKRKNKTFISIFFIKIS